MTRLSLSPEPEEWQQGRFRLRDDDSCASSYDEFVPVSSDDCEYSDSDDEDYPHPVGFPCKPHPSWGRTRFSLDPTVTPDSIEEQWETQITVIETPQSAVHAYMQSYPPVTSYIDPKTASTASLLRYGEHLERRRRLQQENDKEMDQLTQLLRAASLKDTSKALLPIQPADPNEPPYAMLADTPSDIKKKIEQERLRMARDNKQAEEELKKLIRYNDEKADRIRRKEKEEEDRVAAENAARRVEEQKEQAKIDAANKAREDKKRADEKERVEKEKEIEEINAAKAAEKAKKYEYLQRAKKLVLQLQTLRQSIEPFESSKAVSKRRLNMKKVVRGKVNTLAVSIIYLPHATAIPRSHLFESWV